MPRQIDIRYSRAKKQLLYRHSNYQYAPAQHRDYG